MWNYKGLEIEVTGDGLFEYNFQEKYYQENTLESAKNSIDKITKSYYTINYHDYKTLLSKLNSREKHFINAIIEELASYANSAYCGQGLDLDFLYIFIGSITLIGKGTVC